MFVGVSLWMVAKVDRDGSVLAEYNASKIARTATGQYEVVLNSEMGESECFVFVTPWYEPGTTPPLVKACAGLKKDGSTVVINITNDDGKDVDAAFCVMVGRFTPK